MNESGPQRCPSVLSHSSEEEKPIPIKNGKSNINDLHNELHEVKMKYQEVFKKNQYLEKQISEYMQKMDFVGNEEPQKPTFGTVP